MNHKDFENLLKQSLQEMPGGTAGKENTILLSREALAGKQKRVRISFRQFLRRQVRYIGWQIWTVQALFLALFDRMLVRFYGEEFWDGSSGIARLLLCVSILVAMMALPLLFRSRKYRMQEVEAASRFSSAMLLMAKLAVIGIGDILLLGGMVMTALTRTSMEAGRLTVCLLLPFLTMSAAYLFLMGHCGGYGFFVGSTALSCAMILLAIGLPGRWLPLLGQGMTLGGLALCALMLLLFAGQLRYLLRSSSYTELQVT